MSLLTHFVAADVQRLRLAIVLWVTALITETALAQVASYLPDYAPAATTIRMAGSLLSVATTLLSWALVPLIVHLHPAVGSSAFWMTRPIAPGTLVAAKLLLLLLLFIGVPLAIEQILMLMHRVPAADLGRVGLHTALNRGVLMAALAAPAALTPNLARFALLCGGALFAFALLPLIFLSIETLTGGDESPRLFAVTTGGGFMSIPHPQGDPTSLIAAFVLLLVTGIGVLVLQYARRRVRDSVALAIAGLVIASVTVDKWPWPLIHAQFSPPGWAQSSEVLQLHATVSAARFNPPESMHNMKPRWVVYIPLAIVTQPLQGWVVTARVASARVDVAGRTLSTTNESTGGPVLSHQSTDQSGLLVLQHVLGVNRVVDWEVLNTRREGASLMLQMPLEVVSGARTAQVAGEFLVDLAKLEVAAARPLGRMHFQDAAYSIEVGDVREMPGTVSVQARISNVSTNFDRHVRPVYLYFLRSKHANEAVRGAPGGGAYSMGPGANVHVSYAAYGAPSTGGFSVDAQRITFDGREPMASDSPMILTRDWLRDAEFVIVRATYQGSVRRTLELRDLPLGK